MLMSPAVSKSIAPPLGEWQLFPIRSLCPACAILPLPAYEEPSAEVETHCAGSWFRLWTACQISPRTQPAFYLTEPLRIDRDPRRDGWTATGMCCGLRHWVGLLQRERSAGLQDWVSWRGRIPCSRDCQCECQQPQRYLGVCVCVCQLACMLMC